MSILICMYIWKYQVSRCNFRTNTNHSFPWRNIETTDCPLSYCRPYPDGHVRPIVCSICLPICDDARAHLRVNLREEHTWSMHVNWYFDSRSRIADSLALLCFPRGNAIRRLYSSNFIAFLLIAFCYIPSGSRKEDLFLETMFFIT